MMETKCFEAHEIHSGILAANEEFKRRHARPRVGQKEETEFFALVAAAVKLNRTFDAQKGPRLPHALSYIRAAHPEYRRFLDDAAITTLIEAWRNKPQSYDAELHEKATRSLRLDEEAPPMDVGTLMAGVSLPEELVEQFHQVIAQKMAATEEESMPRSATFDALIADAISAPASEAAAPPRKEISIQADAFLAALLLNRTDTAGVSKGGSTCS